MSDCQAAEKSQSGEKHLLNSIVGSDADVQTLHKNIAGCENVV